jgi:hypothetical protein
MKTDYSFPRREESSKYKLLIVYLISEKKSSKTKIVETYAETNIIE